MDQQWHDGPKWKTDPFFSLWSGREQRGPGGEVWLDSEGCVLLQDQVRFQSQWNRTGPVLLGSRVKPGQEDQRVQSVQLHPQTVSFKTSAPWIRHLIYRVVPLLQLCQPALYLSPSLAQPAGLTPVPWIPLPVPSPGARGRFFDGLQLPVWFSKKKKPTKIQRTFWR